MSNKLNLMPLKNAVKVSRYELNHVISTVERLREKGKFSNTDASKRLQYLNEIRNKKTKIYKPKGFLTPGKSNKSVSKEQFCFAKLNKLEAAILFSLWVRIAFLDYNSPTPKELKYLEGYIGKNMANKIRKEITTNMAQEDRFESYEAFEDKERYDDYISSDEYIERMLENQIFFESGR